MDRTDVIAFLEWVTAGGEQLRHSVLNPWTGEEMPDFYRGEQRVTADDMRLWARSWLAEAGRTAPDPVLDWLVREALDKVFIDRTYPNPR